MIYIIEILRSTGGIEAEQAMRSKLNAEEQKTITDSVHAIMSLRRNRNVQITPSASGDSGFQGSFEGRDSTDSLVVSKDYYNEYNSSDDDSDSTDDGSSIKATNPLVCEIVDNDDGGDDSSTRDNSTDNDGLRNLESDIEDSSRDRMREPNATADCARGSREDVDGCSPSIIAKDGDESAERIDENCENSVDSKADTFESEVVNIAAAGINTEPFLKQCSDDRLSLNDSTSSVIEHTKNEFVSVETNYYVDAESNSNEKEKCVEMCLDYNDDENSNENYNNKNETNNHYRNVGGSIENNKTLKNSDSETFESGLQKCVESSPILSSEKTIETSQILCAKKPYTLDIIDHNNIEKEPILFTNCKSNQNETEEISIRLPWLLPSQTEEEYYIKKSSE